MPQVVKLVDKLDMSWLIIEKQIEHLDSLIPVTDVDCLEQLRMMRSAFGRLCFLLMNVGGLKDSRYISINEKVVMFMSILSHHKKNRVVKVDFKRSGQTVSKHFNTVLASVLKLHPVLLANPNPVDDNCDHSPWKWFKGCLGALDGTYVKVTVPKTYKPRYRTRKGDVAVNVLGVCDRNMKFVYVLAGWEGSTADCRVLRDAVGRQNGFKVPRGTTFNQILATTLWPKPKRKIDLNISLMAGHLYLCDNGYTNAEGFVIPYKDIRYHLNEWADNCRAPQNFQEFFNMNHSKARNVIKRTFGLLKKHWGILRSPSFYTIKTQNRIIMACTLLHNFLCNEMPTDPFEADLDDIEVLQEEETNEDFIDTVESSQEWSSWRDNLARSAYDEWRASRNS